MITAACGRNVLFDCDHCDALSPLYGALQCKIVLAINLIVELLNPFIQSEDYLQPSVDHLVLSGYSINFLKTESKSVSY